MNNPSTYVATLTPNGTGAIATLAVVGPHAWEILAPLFRTPRGTQLPEPPPVGTLRFGRLGEAMADEVVLCVRSKQPTLWIECHCHGGREVLRFLTEAIVLRGAVRCSWPQLLLHAQPHSDWSDRLNVECLEALTQASTERTAQILLDQQRGTFRQAIAEVLDAINAGAWEDATGRLEQLAHWIPLGRHLSEPWKVVIAGPPNVGKSSLMNALAGYQRSIVAPIPGTTRDVVTVALAFDGWPIELTDTAGLRSTAEEIEREGVELARQLLAQADFVLWLLDGSAEPIYPSTEEQSLLEQRPGRVLWVVNKADLPALWQPTDMAPMVRVSATTGEGIPELVQRVAAHLVPVAPTIGTAVPISTLWCERIERALESLREGFARQAHTILTQTDD